MCCMILSCVLKREVKNIKFEAQKVIHGASEKSHGIRLDVYVTGKPGADGDSKEDYGVYDVEVDNRPGNKAGLPKRSRYYGSLIDAKWYICESTEANVIDDNTRRLDEIVRVTKTKENVEDDFMYNWDRDEKLKEEASAEERKRADDAENKLKAVESELKAANEVIAKLKAELAEKK